MARSIGRSESAFTEIVHSILDEIKYLFMETENVTIYLSEFGIFKANKKQIVHAPLDKNKA